jgi:hypothetical protein
MKSNCFLTMLACWGFAAATQAGTVSINFQEDGTGDLGSGSKTFTENGISLTAQGFSATGAVDLWEKVTSGDPTETGLGLANDPEHEILPGSFIQLNLPPTGVAGAVLTLIMTTSIQAGETVEVTFGDTSGVFGSAVMPPGPLTGSVTSIYTIPLSSHPFVDITALGGNVLLDGAVIITPNVPDSGSTIVLLSGVITALGLIRRKLISQAGMTRYLIFL